MTMTTESCTNGGTALSGMNSVGYVGPPGHATVFRCTLAERVLFSSRVRVRFSVWLVSGYAHVFVLLPLSLSQSLNPTRVTTRVPCLRCGRTRHVIK